MGAKKRVKINKTEKSIAAKVAKVVKPAVKKIVKPSTSSIVTKMLKTGATIEQLVAHVQKEVGSDAKKSEYNVRWYLNKFTKEKKISSEKGIFKLK